MCERRSHTLAPLNKNISSKVKFRWTKTKKDASEEIKQIVSYGVLFAYTYFNEEFKIHNNARSFQLGVVISQKVKPFVFYSRKVTGAQMRYTVSKK